MQRWFLVIICGFAAAGCSCQPELPDEPDEPVDTSDETPPPDTGTQDTAPPPPCAVPEVEPNGSLADAEALPLEVQGCGDFGEPGDLDFWQFELPQDSWLGVRLRAEDLGSWADGQVVLTTADAKSGVRILYGHGTSDIDLLYPASAGAYDAIITEVYSQGDPDNYFYDLLVTEGKAPLEWDRVADDDNTTLTEADVLLADERVFGDMSAAGDVDSYAVDVPWGKHTVTIDIDAMEFGSAANIAVVLYDSGGSLIREQTSGVQGWERDPYLEYTSTGSERLYVQIVEQGSNNGYAYWYRLTVRMVEGE